MSQNLDPVKILNAAFSARSQRNPRYSLRAFAKSLGVSHTVLSLVLAGKRPLSKKAGLQIAGRLELQPQEAAVLAQGPARNARKLGETYEAIDLDVFHLISDWVHYAILSLLETKGAKSDAKWIAKRLGVSEMHAKVSFERLIALGLISDASGRWKQTGKPIKIENTISTSSTKKFHRQLLERALDSLDNDPIEARDFSSMTIAIDPKHVPYAKERIRQFRRELTNELEAKGKPLEVYNLTVQLYPVSKEAK